MKKITISVTAKDIKKGQSARWPPSKNCAITQALRRQFPKAEKVSWNFSTGVVDGQELLSCAPQKTTTFVGRHDDKKKVSPFKFTATFKEAQ